MVWVLGGLFEHQPGVGWRTEGQQMQGRAVGVGALWNKAVWQVGERGSRSERGEGRGFQMFLWCLFHGLAMASSYGVPDACRVS